MSVSSRIPSVDAGPQRRRAPGAVAAGPGSAERPVAVAGTARTLMVGGIPTSPVTPQELASAMLNASVRSRAGMLPRPLLMFSSNGSVIAAYHHDPAFRDLIAQADVLDADGMPLVLATWLLCQQPIRERVATTDFIHVASDVAVQHGLRFYFLGGKPGIAAKAAAALGESHPGLSIVGLRDGYFQPEEVPQICQDIRDAGTDVLWLGLGSPKQEAFAVAHRDKLQGVACIKTCGGLFDHKAGVVPRAPRLLQSCGLEWLHRVVREPRRLGMRYLTTNPAAAYYLATRTRG